jgi:3,4-dihydroxy 2-butanone 4-phosphate synthase/GTP cyclohydrolase II
MSEMIVSRQVAARIPTEHGIFRLILFHNSTDHKEHVALVMGDVDQHEEVLVRMHSECFTGDVLGSLRCDCGEQLDQSLQMIGGAGSGVVLYLRQEGRGIGLLDKLRAYNLQDEGLDTVEANLRLGHQPDEREYTAAAHMIRDLGIRSINLITNNPAKISELRRLGIVVQRRMPIEVPARPENAGYLRTKVSRMDHLLHLGGRLRISNDRIQP